MTEGPLRSWTAQGPLRHGRQPPSNPYSQLMDFNITAAEEALALHVVTRLRAGDSPTDDDLAEELGEEIRPQLASLLAKGWLVVDAERSLAPSRIAQAALSNRRDADGPD